MSTNDLPQTVQGLTANLNNEREDIYQVTIQQQSYGYLVHVGCKAFAIETHTKLIELLTRYLQTPAEVHKQFFEGTLFQTT